MSNRKLFNPIWKKSRAPKSNHFYDILFIMKLKMSKIFFSEVEHYTIKEDTNYQTQQH